MLQLIELAARASGLRSIVQFVGFAAAELGAIFSSLNDLVSARLLLAGMAEIDDIGSHDRT